MARNPNRKIVAPSDPETPVGAEERILRAAIDLFLAEGFERTTIERVAKIAMVSKATIYGLHASKEALFSDALTHACTRIRAAAPVGGGAGIEALRASLFLFGMDFLSMMWRPETVRLRRVVALEAVRYPVVATAFLEAGPRRVCLALAERLAEGVEAGALRPHDTFKAADRFLASLMGIPDLEITMGLKAPMEEPERRDHVNLAVSLLLEGLKAPAT